MTDTRKLNDLRARINELVANGWSIVGRDPVLLQRGRAKLEVRNGMLING